MLRYATSCEVKGHGLVRSMPGQGTWFSTERGMLRTPVRFGVHTPKPVPVAPQVFLFDPDNSEIEWEGQPRPARGAARSRATARGATARGAARQWSRHNASRSRARARGRGRPLEGDRSRSRATARGRPLACAHEGRLSARGNGHYDTRVIVRPREEGSRRKATRGRFLLLTPIRFSSRGRGPCIMHANACMMQ